MTDVSRKKKASAQEPRRLRTRAALLSAGMAFLGKKPIEAIAIDEIVLRAGVAKGSFFNHFSDKVAFANAIAHEIRARVEDEIGSANSGIDDPALRVARGVSCVAQFARIEPTQMRILLRIHGQQLRLDHPLNRGIKADLEAGLTQGRFKDFEASAGVPYVIGTSHAVIGNVMEATQKRDARESAARLLTLMLTGLGLSHTDAAQIAQLAAFSVIL